MFSNLIMFREEFVDFYFIQPFKIYDIIITCIILHKMIIGYTHDLNKSIEVDREISPLEIEIKDDESIRFE